MENRKISELEEKSFASWDELSAHLYVPAIINEGSEFVNVKVNIKDLLRLIGSNGSGGGSGSGSYDSNVIDSMRDNITALQSAVNSLQNSSRYPTHTIKVQNPQDANDYVEYSLPCGYGAQSRTIVIFSDTVGTPKFYVEYFVNQPYTSEGQLKFTSGGTASVYNGNIAYQGGDINSVTIDIWYRTTSGQLITAVSDGAVTSSQDHIEPGNSGYGWTSNLSYSNNSIDLNGNTIESVEVVLKINGQVVGTKAVVQVDAHASGSITGIVI